MKFDSSALRQFKVRTKIVCLEKKTYLIDINLINEIDNIDSVKKIVDKVENFINDNFNGW